MATKQERLRADIWTSLRPVIEAEMERSGLTAQEVINISLVDYFGLTPKGKSRDNSYPMATSASQQESVPAKSVVDANEDYI